MTLEVDYHTVSFTPVLGKYIQLYLIDISHKYLCRVEADKPCTRR